MYSRKNINRDGSRKKSDEKERGNFSKNTSGRPFRKETRVKEEGERSFRRDSDRSENKNRPYKKEFHQDDRKPSRFSENQRGERGENKEGFKQRDNSDRKTFNKDFSRPSFAKGEKKSYSIDKFSRNKENTSRPKADDGKVRLNKLIAASGICSRREADDMISAGLISVNGSIVTELGTKVFPNDDIRYNGERLRQERLVYIVMNKPKDYITTTKDPFAKRTVMELLGGACKERVFPVGRLDRNTTGVLLITNDGELAKKLSHPSHSKKKVYHVHLDKSLKHPDLEAISRGIELEDGFIKADEISFIDPEDKKQVGVEIHSGRNRIVRRIFEHLGYKVSKLDRVYFAGLTKKGLQRGQWRFLTSQEIGMLKMGSYE